MNLNIVNPVVAEASRGNSLENIYRGSAIVIRADGSTLFEIGQTSRTIFPRSAYKILQALPLIESGAADHFQLDERILAIACSSHEGSATHIGLIDAWLRHIGYDETALTCGLQIPGDATERDRLQQAGIPPSCLHNNCSGKHVGFLTAAHHMGYDVTGYENRDHPLQELVHQIIQDVCRIDSSLPWAIDGCSAPNFALPLSSLALGMARIAKMACGRSSGLRGLALQRLCTSMRSYPFLIAGEGRACSEFARATTQHGRPRAILKVGADGVFTGILPEIQTGFALKVDDGNAHVAELVCAALLIRLEVVDPTDPVIAARLQRPILNRRGYITGYLRPSAALLAETG